jgi:hypothetical protein
MRNILYKIVDEIKTHFMLSDFFFEIRAVYEIMSKNIMEPKRA